MLGSLGKKKQTPEFMVCNKTSVLYQYLCCNPSFGLATKARGCKVAGVKRKEARESKAKALEGCGLRGSPGVITYSRESKEVRGSVRE